MSIEANGLVSVFILRLINLDWRLLEIENLKSRLFRKHILITNWKLFSKNMFLWIEAKEKSKKKRAARAQTQKIIQ